MFHSERAHYICCEALNVWTSLEATCTDLSLCLLLLLLASHHHVLLDQKLLSPWMPMSMWPPIDCSLQHLLNRIRNLVIEAVGFRTIHDGTRSLTCEVAVAVGDWCRQWCAAMYVSVCCPSLTMFHCRAALHAYISAHALHKAEVSPMYAPS